MHFICASVPSKSSLNSSPTMPHLNLAYPFNLFTWLEQLSIAGMPQVLLPYIFLQIFTVYCYVTLIWVLLDTSGWAYLIPHSIGLHSGVAPGTLGKETACQSPDERLLNPHTQIYVTAVKPTWFRGQSVLAVCANQ